MKPLYLAGPMTGIRSFNFPQFDFVAGSLRARGHDIISPAEMDPKDTRSAAMASPDGHELRYPDGSDAGAGWGYFLARDVKVVADESSGVVLLSGWERSRGARLEAFVALCCGLPLYQYSPEKGKNGILPLEPEQALMVITQFTFQAIVEKRQEAA